jgi:hypothetical protein
MITSSEDPKLKPVSRDVLNQKFDENWEDTLEPCSIQGFCNEETREELGFPKGTRTIGVYFVSKQKVTTAIAYKFFDPKANTYCGGREYHADGLLIDGYWYMAEI